jgi:hypothetical protein
VSTASVFQHAKRMHHVVMSSVVCLALPYFFPYHLKKKARFSNKVTGIKMRVFIFSTDFVQNRCHSKKNSGRYCQILMKLEFSRHILKKITHIDYPSCGNLIVPCGRTDRRKGWKTEMEKLIAVLRNFVKAPKSITENDKLRFGRWSCFDEY